MVGGRLFRGSLRHLLRHRWQTALSILGIALGVAVVTAVDLANNSARRAFELSMEQMTGRATHQLLGGPAGIPDQTYVGLCLDRGLRPSAPVVEGRVILDGEAFTLLGLDPFAEKEFRSLLESGGEGFSAELMARGDALAMPTATARRLGLERGRRIELEVEGRPVPVAIAALAGDENNAALDGLLLADIAAAQELLGREGRLDRIDLILDARQAEALARNLPPGLRLVEADARTGAMARMSAAFQTNLRAMSLLALLVGAFLIYNAMTFSVLQRRRLLGMLRVLGATRAELFRLVLAEALVIGLAATLLGTGFGILLAGGLVELVARTINDLYFTVTVTRLAITPPGLLKAGLLGVVTTLAATLGPALEASGASPLAATRRSRIEQRAHRALPWLTAAGAVAMAAGWLVVKLPNRDLGLGFVGLFLLIVGYTLLAPLAVVGLSRLSLPPLKAGFGALGRLAGRGIEASLSRTGLAVAALTLAVAATVGMGIMVGSFRVTVADWLENTLQGDLYVSIPHGSSGSAVAPLPAELPARLRQLPGVAALSLGRRVRVESGGAPVDLLAIEMAVSSHRGFRFKGKPLPGLRARFAAGEAVLVSEPFAWHRQLGTGDRLSLFTASGLRDFVVGGVFYDYGSDRGLAVISMAAYRELWRDPAVSTVGVYLEPGTDTGAVITAARRLAGKLDDRIEVRATGEILEHSMDVFDRTFTITRVLRLLVIGVAFVGILSALMAVMLERRREHAILRATGLLPGELVRLVLLQTGAMGLMAGLLSLPLGWLMARVLIDVINKRAFGWSIQTLLPVGAFPEALLFALAAALLAGLYPALRMMRASPAPALREE